MVLYIILIISIICLFLLIALLIINLKSKSDNKYINNQSSNNDFMKEVGILNNKIEELPDKVNKLNSELIFNNFSTMKENLNESNTKFNNNLSDNFSKFKDSIDDKIDKKFINLNDLLQDKLNEMNSKVEDKLKSGFNTNNDSLIKVNDALIKITESQKNLDALNNEVTKLNGILDTTQTRGKYGEAILGDILYQVFGDTQGIYEEQYAFKNGKIADAIVRMPSPINIVAIDSKFSFVDFERLFDNVNESSDIELKKSFKSRLREQIQKISKDYIIKNITAEYAIMFIPSDGIYQYIQKDNDLYNGIVLFAQKNKILLTSPSTLQAVLLNLNVFRINIQTKNNIDDILKQLELFQKESKKVVDQWEKYSKEVDVILNKKREFEDTLNKLNNRAIRINSRVSSSELIENKKEGKNDTVNDMENVENN